jgi:predicted secreted protein
MLADRYTRNLPDSFSLRVGQVTILPLASAMGGGHSWTATVDGSAVDARIRHTPPPPPDTDPGGHPPRSSSGAEQLQLTPRHPGTARVELRLTRPWENVPALATHTIEVTISA